MKYLTLVCCLILACISASARDPEEIARERQEYERLLWQIQIREMREAPDRAMREEHARRVEAERKLAEIAEAFISLEEAMLAFRDSATDKYTTTPQCPALLKHYKLALKRALKSVQ
jgi:hypothetical protein